MRIWKLYGHLCKVLIVRPYATLVRRSLFWVFNSVSWNSLISSNSGAWRQLWNSSTSTCGDSRRITYHWFVLHSFFPLSKLWCGGTVVCWFTCGTVQKFRRTVESAGRRCGSVWKVVKIVFCLLEHKCQALLLSSFLLVCRLIFVGWLASTPAAHD